MRQGGVDIRKTKDDLRCSHKYKPEEPVPGEWLAMSVSLELTCWFAWAVSLALKKP